MSDATPAFDFSQFVPGFDFLKNLAAGAAASGQGTGSVPGLPSLSSWVAPTLSVEEVIASGTGPQCAKALGMTMGVFYSTVSHARAGISSKYTFYVEKLKKEDFSE